LSASAFGLWILLDYKTSPGTAASPPYQFPKDCPLEKVPGRATLIMLAHPHCPCSRASIGELAWIMARAKEKVQAYVLVLKPAGFPQDWEKTDLWHNAASIPGVQVLCDQGGNEARRFRAATSGQTILYDAQGRLAFNGGITGSRGHSGSNVGRSAVLSFLIDGKAERKETQVFGCALFNDSESVERRLKPWKI